MSEKPARYWRADGGLQDVPRPPSPPPAHLPAMYCFPRFAPWCAQPTMYWQGPIPVGGIFSSTPPPPYVRNPPPPPAPAPPAPRKQEDKKKTEQKKNGNPYAAPSLADGVNYLFDDKKNHTMIHVFNRAGPVWNKEKYRNKKLYVTHSPYPHGNVPLRADILRIGSSRCSWSASISRSSCSLRMC